MALLVAGRLPYRGGASPAPGWCLWLYRLGRWVGPAWVPPPKPVAGGSYFLPGRRKFFSCRAFAQVVTGCDAEIRLSTYARVCNVYGMPVTPVTPRYFLILIIYDFSMLSQLSQYGSRSLISLVRRAMPSYFRVFFVRHLINPRLSMLSANCTWLPGFSSASSANFFQSP